MMLRASHAAAIATALLAGAVRPDISVVTEAERGLGGGQARGAIVVDAAEGIEWFRNTRVFIARGDARAVRGDQEVRADILTAQYRERPDGSMDVWRIDADGHVRFRSPSESAFGEKAIYDIDKKFLTISGGEQVGVTTSRSRITAEKQIDYDTKARTLVARGNAVAVEGDRTLSGDVITAHLREQTDGQLSLQRLEAEGEVRLVTADEDMRADRGTYDLDSGVAMLDGSVKIVKGNNELYGCHGETNLKTGVSKLIACREEADGRVRGMILPESLKKQ
jgi:lipopolysaccharide export system protein LptA